MLVILLVATGIIVVIAIIIAALIPYDSENYKKCPNCGRRIKIETVKCKYCQKLLIKYEDD